MKPIKFKHLTPRGEVKITLEWPGGRANAWYYRFKIRGAPREYKSTLETDVRKARTKAEQAADIAVRAATITTQPCMLRDRLAKYMALHPKNTQLIARLERFSAHFDVDHDLARMDEEAFTGHIITFLAKREPNIEPITLRNERICISGFCSWLMAPDPATGKRAVSWRVNPSHAKLHKRVRVSRKIKPMVQPEDLERLLAASRKTPLHPALILMLSGCRPVGLTTANDWAKINLGEHPSFETFEKNNNVKRALGKWAAAELRQWRAENPERPVLPGDQYETTRQLKMLRRIVGLPDHCTFGALRRTCDFKLYQEGVDPQIAAKIMDHSVTTAMRNYVEYRQLDPKGSVNVLDFSARKSDKASGKSSDNKIRVKSHRRKK